MNLNKTELILESLEFKVIVRLVANLFVSLILKSDIDIVECWRKGRLGEELLTLYLCFY